MGILKALAHAIEPEAAGIVTQTNDPMGILKDSSDRMAKPVVSGYTDQRSDGDTESPTSAGGRRPADVVTQTNDPMGILKVALGEVVQGDCNVTQTNDPMGILKAWIRCIHSSDATSYTDQRSDGDTERAAAAAAAAAWHALHRPTIRWGY